MTRRVVITGLGLISSIGHGEKETLTSLREGRHGFEAWLPFPRSPVRVLGTIHGFDVYSLDPLLWEYPDGYEIPRSLLRSMAPHGLYAWCATQDALASAGWDDEMLVSPETGLYTASAGSPRMLHHRMQHVIDTEGRRADPMGVVSAISGTLGFNLAAALGITGTNCGFVSACTSSAHALGYAWDDIVLGRQKRALVVTGEDVNEEAILPFAGMRALTTNPDPDTASRPFDRKRDGFVGSGGGLCLVLEEEGSARARGAPILARFLGWGQASDGYHIMAPHPEGEGLSRAIEIALRQAKVAPTDLDYINAHATSTIGGDAAEAKALTRLLDGAQVPVSSTKALTGHALSMAGALEASIATLCLHERLVPGAFHLEEPDESASQLFLPRETLDAEVRCVLSVSSGFGGSNVALVLQKP